MNNMFKGHCPKTTGMLETTVIERAGSIKKVHMVLRV